MFLSAANLISHSKRIWVDLVSAAQTGTKLIRAKSPSKAAMRMTLRKHDKIVNRHVIYYESKLPQKRFTGLWWQNINYGRTTGKGAFKTLVGRAQKEWLDGEYYQAWNHRQPGLTRHGKSSNYRI